MRPLSCRNCSGCRLCRHVTAAAGSRVPVHLSLLLAAGRRLGRGRARRLRAPFPPQLCGCPARGAALQCAVPSLSTLGSIPHSCLPSSRAVPSAALPWRGLTAARGPPSPALSAAALLCRCCSSFVQMQHEHSSKCQPAPLLSLISKRNALLNVLLSIGAEDPLFRRFLIWKVNKCTA